MRNFLVKFMVIACLVVLSFSGLAMAASPAKPGLWVITTETEISGLAGMTLPKQTHTHNQCLTQEDLVPHNDDSAEQCTVSYVRQNANTVTWKMTCSEQGQTMEGTGSVTYQGDQMNGQMEMRTDESAMLISNTFTGHWKGSCSATSGQNQSIGSHQQGRADKDEPSALAGDAADVGKAAKDEAKKSTINEVREGVRGLMKGLFN